MSSDLSPFQSMESPVYTSPRATKPSSGSGPLGNEEQETTEMDHTILPIIKLTYNMNVSQENRERKGENVWESKPWVERNGKACAQRPTKRWERIQQKLNKQISGKALQGRSTTSWCWDHQYWIPPSSVLEATKPNSTMVLPSWVLLIHCLLSPATC